MARDAFGNYTLPGTYLAVTGNTILAAQHNDPLEDLASEMSDSLSRSGAGGMSADLAMGGNKITGLGAAAAGTDALSRDAGDARYMTLSGGSLTGGIDFGSTAAGDPDDLSDHIALYGTTVGFSATSIRLNYNIGSSGRHSFYRGGTLVAEIIEGGTATVDENTVMTREKGDARYLELDGTGEMTGNLDMGSNNISHVADPVADNNALNQGFADDRYLRQIGGTMSGSISMSGYNISGLPNPANGGSHAMSRDASDARYVEVAGDTMTGGLSLGGNRLTAVADPVSGADVMDRAYADARYLRLTGGSLTDGIDFGSNAASGPTDLSNHIALYGSSVGFGATSTRIYYNVGAGRHSFYRSGSIAAEIVEAGTATADENTVMTREKGDARYIPNDMELADWSASAGTVYQNTTDAMQFIMAELYFGDTVEISSDNSTWYEVAKSGNDQLAAACVPVPPDWYYRFPGGTNNNKRKVMKTAL